MRVIVQRVHSAAVRVEGEVVGACGEGLFLLVGAHRLDTPADVRKCANKVAALRVFSDENGLMNLGLGELPPSAQPRVLAVSNFTLYGNTTKGRRPSFVESAPHAEASVLFDLFVASLCELGIRTETGQFGAHMDIEAHLNGPVTLVVDVPPSGPVE